MFSQTFVFSANIHSLSVTLPILQEALVWFVDDGHSPQFVSLILYAKDGQLLTGALQVKIKWDRFNSETCTNEGGG